MTKDDMEYEQLSSQIAELRGQLSAMVGGMRRIEEAVAQIVSMDKTIAELVIKQNANENKFREMDHDIKNVDQRRQTGYEVLDTRMGAWGEKHTTFTATTNGALIALKVFSGVVAALLMAAATWAYNQIDNNTRINAQQEYQLATLRQELAEAKATINRINGIK